MWRQENVLIRVHESWSGWRSAEVALTDLEDVHWSQPPGAPHPLIHAFVRAARVHNGDLVSARDASRRNMILVCVLKRHTVPTTYAGLARRADARRAVAPLPPSRPPVSAARADD